MSDGLPLMHRHNKTKLSQCVASPLFDLILTVIVTPLALGAGLGDTQQAADGVGGAQRV